MDLQLNNLNKAINKDQEIELVSFFGKKFGVYDFAKNLRANLERKEDNSFELSLTLSIEKGIKIYSMASSFSFKTTINKAYQRMSRQIEKYKENHYHGLHKTHKQKTQ